MYHYIIKVLKIPKLEEIYQKCYTVRVKKFEQDVIVGFFDRIKKFKKQLDKVESSIYEGKQSFLEIYELNLKLEAEIAQRTKELDTANQQMLTFQHILDMMNSSKPLSSVLNAIVTSLQGELGYLHSCIVKKMSDSQGEYLKMMAYSGSMFEAKFRSVFNCEPSEMRFVYPNISEVYDTIDCDKIYTSRDILKLITNTLHDVDRDIIEKELNRTATKSYILIPLSYNHSHFGSLIVFSSREEASESELKFLKLFSKQIELAITIAGLFQTVKEQAVTDGMTGLYNRRYFEEFVQKEATRSKRQNLKFSIIGIDLDHLKRINDKFGHNYGDMAIKAISEVLKSSCRTIDIAARMGGEEFNVILPGVDTQGGMIFAERIRKTIESIPLEKIGHITASIGVGAYMEHSDDIDELSELVDHAMYESKRSGRNRVTVAKPASETSWQDVAISAFTDILSKHRIPIDKRTSLALNKKLQEMNINNDMLYQVSDTLISTYNPKHSYGGTKKKVILATLLAKRFELPKENIDKLKIAVLLYDIGNTMLPKEVLFKTTPLSDDERESIKQHPLIAAREILKPISDVGDIIPIIEKHHENWNGSGYPEHLSGESIPIESQIILIVDSYFALLEDRPYRKAMPKQDAVKTILVESGTKWSEALANEFAAVINNEDFND